MNRMIISEDEKSRILEMHKNAILKQYLVEEDITQPQAGTTTQTTTQPQAGTTTQPQAGTTNQTTTQPETVGGGGTAYEKLRTFIESQPAYVEDEDKKTKYGWIKIRPATILKQMDGRLQFDGVYSTQNNIEFRYVIKCVPNPKKGNYILDPATDNTLFPLQCREFNKGWSKWTECNYASTNIYPKQGKIGKFIANACNALVSTQK